MSLLEIYVNLADGSKLTKLGNPIGLLNRAESFRKTFQNPAGGRQYQVKRIRKINNH